MLLGTIRIEDARHHEPNVWILLHKLIKGIKNLWLTANVGVDHKMIFGWLAMHLYGVVMSCPEADITAHADIFGPITFHT
jgi:hypothetical protein